MLPIGAILNAAAIFGGGGVGMALGRRIPEMVRACIFQGLGLSVLAVGIKLTLRSTSPEILIASIVLGGAVGSALRLEERIANASLWVKAKLRSGNPLFADGLVVSVTVFCCGSLALLGPLDEGVRGDHFLLSTKAFIDGLTAIAFASAYGAGVLVSALLVLVYEGAATYAASAIGQYVAPAVVTELSAVGGVLTIGIAINMLEIRHIALPNLLPSLVFTVILASWFL
ncbi:MAG: DUF554 domain-containing protein [Humidesulfovibrio sp.]|nr:DUF554 domain-containing protein [Humidesulfovibrio sp.]